MSKSVRTGGLADRAYNYVKQSLVSGEAPENEWFQIDEIAKTIGTSRQPVMDALRRLSFEGFVEIVPQVGCRPKRPKVEEIRDFFRFFAEGEALIAELAAMRASPEGILAMRLVSAQIGALAAQGGEVSNRGDLYRTFNRQLHAEMRKAAESPALAEIVEGLGDRSDFFIACFKDKVFTPNLQAAHREHEEIIEAIANRNAPEARASMLRHISATESRLEAAL